MTLQEIIAAVEAGKHVCWHHSGYRVVKDRLGQFLIGFSVGMRAENWIGLTNCEGQLQGQEQDFFILGEGTPDGEIKVPAKALKLVRRELEACRNVIHLAGTGTRGYGFDEAYVTGAAEALQVIDRLLGET